MSKRDIIIFLAGAQAFHTLTHIALMFSRLLPFKMYGIAFTVGLNNFAVIFNAISTISLLWWADKLSNEKRPFWKWW